VKGASEGEGLGNDFLSNISATDGILHMIRAFDSVEVTHVEGDINPIRDLEIIHEELRLKDVFFLEKEIERRAKLVKRDAKNKDAQEEFEMMQKFLAFLTEDKKDIRLGVWTAKEVECLNNLLLLTSKPVVYLVNVTERDYIRKRNKWLQPIMEWVKARDTSDPIIPWSGELEGKLYEMDPEGAKKYLEDVKATSAMPRIIKTAFKKLQLQYFFTAGTDEVRAWTIREGDRAPTAAGKIHTDFERGFIMAEVMSFEDFKEHENEAGVKAAGKYRMEGKNYVVKDGDIIFFKFNVTTAKKK